MHANVLRYRGIIALVFTAAAAYFLLCVCGEARSADVKQPEFQFWADGKVKEGSWYDDQDRVRVRRWFNNDGSLERRERYDRHGNKVEEVNYDESGRIEEGADGWAAMRWYYDDNGVLRVQVWYGEDGKLQKRKFYTEGGNLLDTQFMGDENINPDEEHSDLTVIGSQVAEYYDSYGNRKYAIGAID